MDREPLLNWANKRPHTDVNGGRIFKRLRRDDECELANNESRVDADTSAEYSHPNFSLTELSTSPPAETVVGQSSNDAPAPKRLGRPKGSKNEKTLASEVPIGKDPSLANTAYGEPEHGFGGRERAGAAHVTAHPACHRNTAKAKVVPVPPSPSSSVDVISSSNAAGIVATFQKLLDHVSAMSVQINEGNGTLADTKTKLTEEQQKVSELRGALKDLKEENKQLVEALGRCMPSYPIDKSKKFTDTLSSVKQKLRMSIQTLSDELGRITATAVNSTNGPNGDGNTTTILYRVVW